MKKNIFICLSLSLFSFLIYFGFGTHWTGKIRQELDHYNSLAHSFREGRLDIRNTPVLDELSQFHDKWYPYYGPLPALPIALLQIISKKEFIPTLYPNAAVGALAVGAMFLLLKRLHKTFFPNSRFLVVSLTTLFAFGTVHFWISNRSGVWFQAQAYQILFSTLGIIPLVTKKRRLINYFLSVLFLSTNLLVRPHTALLLSIPAFLFLFSKPKTLLRKGIVMSIPLFILFGIFAMYNFARFGNVLETGVSFQHFHYRFAGRYAQAHGWFSVINVPYNLWFMTLEIPRLTWKDGFTPISRIDLESNPEGNSIFFLTPPLLAIFFALPWKEKDREKRKFLQALWAGVILTLVPILLLTGTGWQQFGYRYTLDVTAPLLLLVAFGIKGKITPVFLCGMVFAISLYRLGVWTT